MTKTGMFKVGDLVMIKPNLREQNYPDEERHSSGTLVVDSMLQYAGLITEIARFNGRNYQVVCDGGYWHWSYAMFTPIQTKEANENLILETLGIKM